MVLHIELLEVTSSNFGNKVSTNHSARKFQHSGCIASGGRLVVNKQDKKKAGELKH